MIVWSLWISGDAAVRVPTLEPVGAPVGCVECDGPAAFGAVMGLAVLGDGALVVLDRDEPMVRIFSPDGSVERAFGRRGRGPGEIARPASVAVTEPDRIWVSDFMGTALTRFERDGRYVERLAVESMATGLRSDPAGRWMAWQVADWQAMAASVRARSPAGEVSVPLASTVGRFLRADGQPASPGLLSLAPAPDGRVAVGYSSTYRIEVLDPSGDVVRVIERDIPRTERTDEEIAELARARARGPRGGADNPEAGARPSDIDPLRPHFFMGGLAWDGSGRLWVRTARGGPSRTVFDLFDPEGEYVGEVEVDAFLGHVTIVRDTMVAVVEDPDFGVERVRRWRIVG
jgi:hypothetical protein